MELELLLLMALMLAGLTFFAHFEEKTSKWRRLLKWAIYVVVTVLIGRTAGRPWTFAWILFLPLVGVTFHFCWCHKHGIHPLTAEPRDKYYALRGWK
jgi:uncharacterized membrane protein HdeD (DUF308 family)